MRVDLSRVASAAVEAALVDETPRRRLSAPKAIATGAALALAARYAVSKAPGLPRLSAMRDLSDVTDRVREHVPGSVAEHIPHIPDSLRERLAEHGLIDDDGLARRPPRRARRPLRRGRRGLGGSARRGGRRRRLTRVRTTDLSSHAATEPRVPSPRRATVAGPPNGRLR